MTNLGANLPVLSNEGSLAFYMEAIKKFPMLHADEEYTYAKAWRSQGDLQAAHRLVTSHLRLVAKIAMGYRGYGLPVADLIAEGNIGLMQAVKRFDPEKGFRLSTYAMWWIKASIQEYILHSWSLVKIGTTAAQKRLFFNLRRMKKDLQKIDEGQLTPAQIQKIAQQLNVAEQEVVNMEQRLSGPDHSLNALVRADGDSEWQDWLVDERDNQETKLGDSEELTERQKMLQGALACLNARERAIIARRRMTYPPATLEDLAQEYQISRERVRQIEAKAFGKLQTHIRSQTAATLPALPSAASASAASKA
ncbi:MAG: RNA polymerase sigma factor RpoH [Alphaproteobacteria bacterium]|nr:RNA polymerase sigma factor RpoH [Alphaproteobacteria bacterium]